MISNQGVGFLRKVTRKIGGVVKWKKEEENLSDMSSFFNVVQEKYEINKKDHYFLCSFPYFMTIAEINISFLKQQRHKMRLSF